MAKIENRLKKTPQPVSGQTPNQLAYDNLMTLAWRAAFYAVAIGDSDIVYLQEIAGACDIVHSQEIAGAADNVHLQEAVSGRSSIIHNNYPPLSLV